MTNKDFDTIAAVCYVNYAKEQNRNHGGSDEAFDRLDVLVVDLTNAFDLTHQRSGPGKAKFNRQKFITDCGPFCKTR